MSTSETDSGEQTTSDQPAGHDQAWGEVQRFIAELSELSQSDTPLPQYADAVLGQTLAMLSASAGAVWICPQPGQLSLQCRRTADPSDLDSGHSRSPSGHPLHETPTEEHRAFLQHLVQSSQIGEIRSRETRQTGNLLTTLAGVFRLDRSVAGVIEISRPGNVSNAGLQGNKRLLAMVCDLMGDYLQRQQIRDLNQSHHRWNQFATLVQRAHQSLDLTETAYRLVGDGRIFVGCDRVSLAVRVRGKLNVVAISGVDTLDKRSGLVQSMTHLADCVAQTRQRLRFRGETDDLPPQLEQAFSRFSDQAHSQTIDVVPLLDPQALNRQTDVAGHVRLGDNESTEANARVVGVLILERFAAAEIADQENTTDQLASVAAYAVRNAQEYQTLPLLSLSHALRRMLSAAGLKSPRFAACMLAIALTAIALILIPAQMTVSVGGTLEPVVRQNLYAPMDSEVVSVECEHDETVEKDAVLIQLRSRDLQRQRQQLQGEYQATQKKLLAIASARVQQGRNDRENSSGRTDSLPGQLAAEEVELQQLMSSLEVQLSIIDQQQSQLTVRSPFRGQVLTWNPTETLGNRPVSRGQTLIRVADVSGPWQIRMDVADRDVGHLLTAQQTSVDPLEVTFDLATGESISYRARVTQVAGRSEVVDGQRSTVRVVAGIDDPAESPFLPGATVHANIHCGRRSLGYVWFYDLYQSIRTWLLF